MGLSYESSGVNYDRLDAFKRACQREAGSTRTLLDAHGMSEVLDSRGDSAYLMEAPDAYWAHVEEGLGTKNLVADAMQKATGRSYYRAIGVDTVATIVNDLITCGAVPISVAMHAAVGSGDWFADEQRAADLARGFADGCREAGAVWGGGETPALKGVVQQDAIVLAGSAIGRIAPKSHRIIGDVRDGDVIILLASSGVHTNGLTLCRRLAEELPSGYETRLACGQSYGEALLTPSVIYVRFVTELLRAGLRPSYAVHLTGHGWRKLMRLNEPFVYRLTDIGTTPEIFRFLQERGRLDDREAYGTFNMGAGFAVFVRESHAQDCLSIAAATGYRAWVAGRVEKSGDDKRVQIEPLGLTFDASSLKVR